ncbi:MAG: hypothetical protein ACREQ5_36765 [Candidatus Dormibacteria bacterium]
MPMPAVSWHVGGSGPCEVCSEESEERCVVEAARPKRLCGPCGQGFLDGDAEVIAAVFIIPPEDTSGRQRRRR